MGKTGHVKGTGGLTKREQTLQSLSVPKVGQCICMSEGGRKKKVMKKLTERREMSNNRNWPYLGLLETSL